MWNSKISKMGIFLFFTLIVTLLLPEVDSYASQKGKIWENCPEVDCHSFAIIDVETGTILLEKNMYDKRYPASITKVMTALLTVNHAKSYKDKVKFNKKAVTAEDIESKTLWLQEGEVLTVEDCLYGLLLESANDIAKGLAFYVGGSIENFAKMMNEKASELGCVNTNFTNPHGLFDKNHYTCAADMAKIMRACARTPKFVEIAGTVRYQIPKTNKFEYKRYLLNDSKMLLKKNPYYYDKCYGAKTGYIDEARKTYVAMAKKGKVRLAGVILGTNSYVEQYKGMERLFEYCFEHFKLLKASEISIKIEAKEGDLYSKILKQDPKAKLNLVEHTKLIVPKKYDLSKLKIKPRYNKLSKIQAGYNGIGKLVYFYDGKQIGEVDLFYKGKREFLVQ